ncbi:MAG TPA: ComEC/Rec2 family competence protein, partial [Patescibacteria group bacterium]|nr:ComEC/Rec2 family competence protein [Patescibacteria group bacterium]
RAATMGLLVLFAERIGRRKSGLTLLLFAAAAMLLWNPKILFADAGFQLSFLATFGLLEIVPRIEQYFKWFPDILGLRTIFVATLSAQLMTLPVIISTFHLVSLVAPITNLLVLPLVPLVMLLGVITGFVGMVSIPAGSIVGFFALIPIWYELFVVQFFSSAPFSAVSLNIFPWVVWLVFAFVLAAIFREEMRKIFLFTAFYTKKRPAR